MRFIGVDLAAQAKGTSLCVVDWKATPRIEAVHRPATDEHIIRLAADPVAAIGLDSPFGWPDAFVSFVRPDVTSPHPAPLTNDDADRLKFRATDRWLRTQNLPGSAGRRVRPLSVATDKLGAVALRCVRLVQCLEAVRGDQRTIYEVYPAASLARWGIELDGSYKKKDKRNEAASKVRRRRIIERLVEHELDLGTFEESLVASDDDLDALVSALTAALAFAGQTDHPPPDLAALARSEGWIHIPSGPLLDLSSLDFSGAPSHTSDPRREHLPLA